MANNSQQKETIQKIRKSARQLVRELDVVKGVYLNTGYTFSQCHVLFELNNHKTLTLMQLVDILLIDKSNASRTIKQLTAKGLIQSEKGKVDSRQKFFQLTDKGKKALQQTTRLADTQVQDALLNLTEQEAQTVVDGLHLYQSALHKSRLQAPYKLRPIKKRDNSGIASVIRDVMTEFGAVGDGYSITDPEVDDMFGNYNNSRSCYFVIANEENEILGGGGIGPLKGGGRTVCELRKMFFRPSLRGISMGRRLLTTLMLEAQQRGYKKCYLETLERMPAAIRLYEKNGFEAVCEPIGKTGHCACDRYFVREL